MNSMTLEQLRATASAGGVIGVTLKGQDGGFFVKIATRSGREVVLSKARSREPRRFGNPASALSASRDLGICVVQIDATHWNPGEEDMSRGRQGRADAMRAAHKAAAYSEWLAAEIQEGIDDPRPSIPHDEVMADMDAQIADMTSAGKHTLRAEGEA